MKRKVKRVIFFGGRRDRDEGDSESGILGGIGGIIGKIFGGFPTTLIPSPICLMVCSGLDGYRIFCGGLGYRRLAFHWKRVFLPC